MTVVQNQEPVVGMRSSEPQTGPSTRRRQHSCEETSPIPGTEVASPSHVLGNRRRPDIDSKLEEFAVDLWSARVCRKLKLGRSGDEVRQGWRVI